MAIPLIDDVSAIITVTGTGLTAIKALHAHFRRRRISAHLNTLFPVLGEPIAVTTGALKTSNSLDPEDKFAATALLKVLYSFPRRFQEASKITYIDRFPEIDRNCHVIAIGGPYSNPVNRDLAHLPPFSKSTRPLTPLFLRLNPRTDRSVTRLFNNRPHARPMWAIIDQNANEIYYPRVDSKGWLLSDFLMITVMPLARPANDFLRYRISFMGLYGTGVMATELLLRSNEGLLSLIDEARGSSPYFQSLVSVDEIERSSGFSRGTRLRHIVTYPLNDARLYPRSKQR